jgi:hypothetical protein
MSIEILNRMSSMMTELAARLGNALIELGNQGIQYGRSAAEIEALPSVIDGHVAIEKCEALAKEFDQQVIVQLAQLNQARPWIELRERVFAIARKGKRSAVAKAMQGAPLQVNVNGGPGSRTAVAAEPTVANGGQYGRK